MSPLRSAVRLGAQRTRKHKHHMLTHSHLHPFTCTQTSNRALLKLQIIRNTLHCGRSESFLIKFKGRLSTWHTHTHTLFICSHAASTPHHFTSLQAPVLSWIISTVQQPPHLTVILSVDQPHPRTWILQSWILAAATNRKPWISAHVEAVQV